MGESIVHVAGELLLKPVGAASVFGALGFAVKYLSELNDVLVPANSNEPEELPAWPNNILEKPGFAPAVPGKLVIVGDGVMVIEPELQEVSFGKLIVVGVVCAIADDEQKATNEIMAIK